MAVAHLQAAAPPLNTISDDGSAMARIKKLRALGWSDRSIARHTGLPLDAVQNVLGIKVYDKTGNVVPPVNVIVECGG